MNGLYFLLPFLLVASIGLTSDVYGIEEPLAPTNDGVIDGTNLIYNWTFGTNFDNATQPAITNSSAYVGDTAYLYSPLKNQNETQETETGAIITTSDFEGLFHFDSIEIFESSESTHSLVTSGSDYGVGYSGYRVKLGQTFDTNHAISEKTIIEVSFYLLKMGSPTGTATINMLDSSKNILHEFGTLDISTLTGSNTKYTFNTGSYVMPVDGALDIEYDAGSSGNVVSVRSTSGSSAEANTEVIKHDGTSWSHASTDDLDFEVKYFDVITSGVYDYSSNDDHALIELSGGSLTFETSSIDSGLSNEFQFNNAGLNITSTSYPSGTDAFTINGIVTLNQTESMTLFSFDSGSEVKLNIADSFIAMSKGGIDLFNHTLTISLSEDVPQAITIKRSSSGEYETFVNGTRSPDSSTTDVTTLGTAKNNLYHVGFDTSLNNSGTWRLDELSILSTELSNEDVLDFGNRIIPFAFENSTNGITSTFTHEGLPASTNKCFYVKAWNSIGASDPSGIMCGLVGVLIPLHYAITDLTLLFIDETNAFLSWSTPHNYGTGNVTGYQINYTTPIGTPLTIAVNDTENLDTNIVVVSLTENTWYSFRASGISELGLNLTGASIVHGQTLNSTSFVNTTSGGLSFDAINPLQISPITYTRTDYPGDGLSKENSVLIDIDYPPSFDLNCDVNQKFANTNSTYTNLNSTDISASEVRSQFNFTNPTNEVITLDCYDTITGESAVLVLTNNDFVLLDVLAQARSGVFGTFLQYGGLDLITLIVIIFSMIGFNRKDPIVGVIFNTIIIGVTGYYGIINAYSVMTGATVTIMMFIIFSKRSKN